MINAANATEISIAANLKDLWLLETKEKQVKKEWYKINSLLSYNKYGEINAQ